MFAASPVKDPYDKDVFFTPLPTPVTFYWRAQRYGVLVPLFGRQAIASRRHIVGHVQELVRLWRGLNARPGLDLPRGPDRLRKRLNCRPGFMQFRPHTNYCHEATICPFCWARGLGEVWSAFDRFAFPQGTGRVPSEFDLQLTTRRLDFAGDLPALLGGRAVARRAELRRLRYLAGHEVVSVEPLVRRDDTGPVNTLKVSVRQLFVTERGAPLGDLPASVMITVYPSPTRGSLAINVARLCRYPVGFLKPPTPDFPVAPALNSFLAARKGRRLWNALGDLTIARPEEAPCTKPSAT